MKHILMTATLILALPVAAQTPVSSTTGELEAVAGNDQMALKTEARQHIKAFGGELKATVKAGMKSGGPMAAIPLCNTQAPAIRDRHNTGDWQIGRTSLKIRNPNNAPDEWERSVLESFDQRLAAGEAPATLEASRIEQGEYRYMKAIPAGAPCMHCHGQNLKPEVAAKLADLYPDDQAVGYLPGQLRGAFTLRKPLEF